MKKSLFAIAAVTAFAGAAQAQSSVTVYGILDVGYVGTSTRVDTNGLQNPYGPYGLATNSTGALTGTLPRIGPSSSYSNGFTGNGAETTSRLGFRGTEDLGGGLSAFFTIEMAIAPQSEQVVSTAATQNRQTFVGLKKNGIGQFSIGTQYTPIHLALANTDPGQYNNIVGNVIYPSNSGTFGVPGNNNTSSYTVRTNNMLYLKSDTFAGFTGSAFYTQNNSNSNQTTPAASGALNDGGYRGGNNNQNGWGLGLNYQWQKLLVTANYQSFNSKNPYGSFTYALGTTASSNAPVLNVSENGVPAAFVNSSGGQNIKDNQQYYAIAYDFGILKAFAQYVDRKATSQFDSSVYAKRSAQQIGVRSFITPKIEGWASGGTGRATTYGAGSPTSNFNGWQLGSNYYLSKRTNLYAIYGQTISSTAAYDGYVDSKGVAQSGTGNINSKASQYALGVRHTF